jgi:hypothetical protein
MNHLRHITCIAVLFGLTHFAYAQTDHSTHDMPSATAATPNGQSDMMKKMDAQIQAMKDMHQKMSTATTDAERQALMKDHMKVMREGMQMMSGHDQNEMHCKAGGKTSSKKHHQMMEKHKALMQSMMQMMNDHLQAMPQP